MAISECNNSELVGGTCAVFSCCEDRARAIIAQAEQYNYLYLLKGRIEEHEYHSRNHSGTFATEKHKSPECDPSEYRERGYLYQEMAFRKSDRSDSITNKL